MERYLYVFTLRVAPSEAGISVLRDDLRAAFKTEHVRVTQLQAEVACVVPPLEATEIMERLFSKYREMELRSGAKL